MKKTCKACGKEFELSQGEIQFYKSKNLELPKRCKECRDKNKVNRTNTQTAKQTSYHTQNTKSNTYGTQAAQPNENRIQNNSGKNSRNFKHRISAAIAAIFLLTASLFGGHFMQDGAVNPNTDKEAGSSAAYTNGQTDTYTFRNDTYLSEHFEKHGEDFDYTTIEEYQAGANRVIASGDALHKTEKEDGDDVYYLKSTNEFVIVSTDGYIRTYFKPRDGIAYYNRQ